MCSIVLLYCDDSRSFELSTCPTRIRLDHLVVFNQSSLVKNNAFSPNLPRPPTQRFFLRYQILHNLKPLWLLILAYPYELHERSCFAWKIQLQERFDEHQSSRAYSKFCRPLRLKRRHTAKGPPPEFRVHSHSRCYCSCAFSPDKTFHFAAVDHVDST